MDIRVFVVLAIASAAFSLLTRGDRRVSLAIALIGLVGSIGAAYLIGESTSAELLDARLVATPFLRWFLVIGSVGALLACLLALATRWQPDLPAATLAALGGCALALSIDAMPIALLAATAAGALGLISLATPHAEVGATRLMLGYLQGLSVAGAVAIVAAAWLVGANGPVVFEAATGGSAALAMALALAIRLGAVPFHRPAARIVGAAVPLGIPLLLAWLPVLMFLVALTWSHRVLLAQPVDIGAVRVLLVLAGAGTLLVGAIAAVLRPAETDDVQHVISYGIVQDAGFFLLAFGAFDAAVWREARVWSLYFVASKLGLAAWLAAILAVRGDAAIPSLEGWARRSPLLAIALVGAVVAGLGLPGFDSFDARLAIIQSATDRVLRWVAYGGWLLAYVPFVRILWIGLRTPGESLPLPARFRLRVPRERPDWRDARATVRYVADAAVLSRLTIATILTVMLGLGAAFLALGHASLSEAAAILPEPIVPGPTPGR